MYVLVCIRCAKKKTCLLWIAEVSILVLETLFLVSVEIGAIAEN